ncbi:MAG TPA: hypothetical protein VL309_03625 [Vicinamibacterales bacterium]|nr:hypothetical protein [Vicinamibacterales bacterium]
MDDGRRIRPWRAGAALVSILIPFVAVRHVQEDAYITFRAAANLAATGVYGFNPGERASASSSHLAVFIGALVRLGAADAFIPILQLLYGAAAVAGIWWLACSLVPEPRRAAAVWIAVSLLPVSLMAAYSGMETGLVLLAAGLAVHATTRDRFSPLPAAAFALFPWVRPDAVAIGLLVLVAMGVTRRPSARAIAGYAAILTAGSAAWLLFNRLYFGTLLTQTMIGKAAVWLPATPGEAVRDGTARLIALVAGTGGSPGLFQPLASKYANGFALPGAIAVFGCAAAVACRPHRFGVHPGAAAAVALLSVALPVAYAAGNVVYPWYLWPAQIAAYLLAACAVSAWLAGRRRPIRRAAAAGIAVVIVALAAAQWLLAVTWGTEERLYRGGIGERIGALAAPGDTLLLEPAGSIPFYAGVRTWDEIGLATPEVTRYRRAYGRQWWIRFVQDRRPTFLVEREHMLEDRTLDGYALSPDERRWFHRRYALVQTFEYDPGALRASPVLARVARLGSARRYLLYKTAYDPPATEPR